MSSRNKATDFIRAMNPGPADDETSVVTKPVTKTAKSPVASKPTTKSPTRANLKHFGGYLDDDTLEKIALLRIRLKKDNSELIKFAIEELHRKHMAKRAFGDA